LLKKNFKNCLILIILASFVSSTSFAQTPTSNGVFLQVEEGQRIPFAGWCFDDIATAKVMAKLQNVEQACQLRIEKHLEIQAAESGLVIDNLKLRVDTLQKEYDNVVNIKDEQIESLEAAAAKRPNSYLHWAAIGGFVAGSLVTLAILHAGD